jgi:hypothetical protein
MSLLPSPSKSPLSATFQSGEMKATLTGWNADPLFQNASRKRQSQTGALVLRLSS